MNLRSYFFLLFLACAITACSSEPPKHEIATPPIVPPVEVKPDTPSGRAAKAIDAILYSNASKEEQLAQLRPYVAPMDTKQDIQRKSDLQIAWCFGSGPGVEQCGVEYSGLNLVFDPEGKLRIIRRDARSIAGIVYPEMSLTPPGFAWRGYRRWYPN